MNLSKMNPESVQILVDIIKQSYNNNNTMYLLEIDIQSIDGIKCSVNIYKNPNDTLRLRVESIRFYDGNGEYAYFDKSFNHSTFQEIKKGIDMKTDIDLYLHTTVPLLLSTINELKFNKKECVFVTSQSCCNSSPNVKLDFDTCCVCHENIKGKFKTECGHSLCIPCWDEIKEINDEIPCPLCCQDISFYA